MKPVYNNITLKQGPHIAGITNVKVAAREWLTHDAVIDFETGKIITPIISSRWLTLEFTADSYEYDEKQKSNKSGSYYEISLSGLINNYDAPLQQTLNTLRYHEFVAIVLDCNRLMRFVGSKEAGLVFSVNNKTQNSARRQMAEVLLTMESEDPAPFFEPVFTP